MDADKPATPRQKAAVLIGGTIASWAVLAVAVKLAVLFFTWAY